MKSKFVNYSAIAMAALWCDDDLIVEQKALKSCEITGSSSFKCNVIHGKEDNSMWNVNRSDWMGSTMRGQLKVAWSQNSIDGGKCECDEISDQIVNVQDKHTPTAPDRPDERTNERRRTGPDADARDGIDGRPGPARPRGRAGGIERTEGASA